MYYHTALTALCFILISCASGNRGQTGTPPWIQNTPKNCPPELLCALGEGHSTAEAEQNAKIALAKIFQTQVTGSTQSHASQEHFLYQQRHQEIFDETLHGVQVLHRHQKQGQFFALASLHKKKSAQHILHKAQYEDTQLAQHYRKSNMAQYSATYKRWQTLQERYFFLTGKRISPKIKYDQMLEKMRTLQKFRTQKIILIVSEDDDLGQHFIKQLATHGYRTTDKKNLPFHLKLVPNMNIQQLHFNVPQFKKYEFSLNIRIYDSTEKQKIMLSLKKIESGRSLAHARELAMKIILIGLEKKIDSLLKEQKI